MTHQDYMRQALALARDALETGDVPVGCVVVCGNKIVGRGRNRREERRDASAHAEMEAIRQACGSLGRWRLSDCTLYVTLEPCAMCAGAILNARMGQVWYGAADTRAGCLGSVLALQEEGLGHRPQIYGGLLEEDCKGLLMAFFEGLREKKQKIL